jgi:outer membrane receptor protein involved in Fe transport
MQSKLIRVVMFLGVCSLLLSSSGFAQAVYGSIFGSITDTTGAAVPNATVTVTDTAKGTSTTVQSNGNGEFTVEHLIPDPYDVKIAATGFKGYQQTGIQLFADTSTKIAAALTIGDAAGESITVNSDAVPQLKTDRADVSTIFGAQEIQDLPVGDRNFTNLQLLLPGAQLLGWGHAPDENPQGSRQIQVDGQAFGGVAFELDGTDNQDPILGIIVINPNIDSLSESKITTQNFDAEFGKAVSSVVTAQTKSGSNHFHGSLFDYRTSTANLAKDPYLQFPGSPIAPGLKNQFGGSLGGPVFKDKVFFFGDYQGARQRVGITSSSLVPTALATSSCLSGTGCNFSEYVNVGGAGNGIIYQPNGQPYPNNTIPNSALSAPALAYLKLIAPYTPNKAGASGLIDVYTQGGTGIFNSDQWDARVDYQLSGKIHTFGRFSRFTDTLSGNTLFGEGGGPGFGLGGYGGTSKGANDSLALGADAAVNNSLVTDFRLGYYRYDIVDQKFDATTQEATALGFNGLNIAGNAFTNGLPGFEINMPQDGQTQWGAGLNINRCNCPLTEKEDQFQVVNNWTKTIGNHSVKVGADLRYARNLRVPSDTDRTGLFTFNTISTGLNANTTNGSGLPVGGLGLASYVLGDTGQYGRYVSTSTNAKEFQKRDFFYGQDTWRATSKLTLNLGLRYELYFPESVNAPGNGALMDLATGYLHVAGIGGVPSDMGWQKATNAYNPRVGIAYQATERTVVRAGYGRSFDLGVFGSIFGHVVTQNLPVLANQEISGPGDATTYAQPFNLSTGPQPNVFPTVPSNGLLPNPGSQVNSKARPNSLRLPTIDAWNLSIQQALSPTWSLTMAYVGNKGSHTLSAGDGNNTNPNETAIVLPGQYSVIPGTALHYDPSVSGTTVGIAGGPAGISANGGTANVNYLTRYYGGSLPACKDPAYVQPAGLPAGACGWTQGISYYGDDQDTHFNALQVSIAKQMVRGISLNANYAWQRGFNFSNTYATWNKQVGKGRDDSIREQQLIAYGLFELPFGRSKPFLSKANPIVNEIVGGWQLSPVLNLASGLPFTLSVASCAGSVPQGGQSNVPCYPNGNPSQLRTSLGKFNPVTHSRKYFSADPTDFSAPLLDQVGNVGRNSNWGPGSFNTDLAVQKNFPIKESLFAQFRVDFANVFNHINAANPSGNVDSDGVITSGAGGVGVSNPRALTFSGRLQF